MGGLPPKGPKAGGVYSRLYTSSPKRVQKRPQALQRLARVRVAVTRAGPSVNVSAGVSPTGWPCQDPPDRRVNPLIVAFLRWDPSAGQFLGDPIVRPSITPQLFGHADDLLFAGMSRQLFARRVSRIEDKTVWYRAGTFTSPDLLLQNFVDTFCDLFPLQLRDGGQNGQDRAAHRGIGVDLLGNRHQVLSSTDEHVLDQHDEIADTAGHSIQTRHADTINLVVSKSPQDFLETLSVETLAGLAVIGNDVDQLRVCQFQVPFDALALC